MRYLVACHEATDRRKEVGAARLDAAVLLGAGNLKCTMLGFLSSCLTSLPQNFCGRKSTRIRAGDGDVRHDAAQGVRVRHILGVQVPGRALGRALHLPPRAHCPQVLQCK